MQTTTQQRLPHTRRFHSRRCERKCTSETFGLVSDVEEEEQPHMDHTTHRNDPTHTHAPSAAVEPETLIRCSGTLWFDAASLLVPPVKKPLAASQDDKDTRNVLISSPLCSTARKDFCCFFYRDFASATLVQHKPVPFYLAGTHHFARGCQLAPNAFRDSGGH